MNHITTLDLARLCETLADVMEAIEDTFEDDVEPADITEANTLAEDFIDRYLYLLDTLGTDDRCRLQQNFALKVEYMKSRLARLPAVTSDHDALGLTLPRRHG